MAEFFIAFDIIMLDTINTYTGCSLNIEFFPKNSQKFATSPSLALRCYWLYKKGQPIGGTVHSHCVENFEGLLKRYVGEGGVAVICEKTQFFPEHPVCTHGPPFLLSQYLELIC